MVRGCRTQIRSRANGYTFTTDIPCGERAAAEGLAGHIEYIEEDYRNITGHCDAFVSIGMLEHVGRENYQTLGGLINRCLTPPGRGLIHSIARDQPYPMNAWIERRIFPGSYPPTLREMGVCARVRTSISAWAVKTNRGSHIISIVFWII